VPDILENAHEVILSFLGILTAFRRQCIAGTSLARWAPSVLVPVLPSCVFGGAKE
jgi:hypothetical protein